MARVSYIAWVRNQPCCVCGAAAPSHAHHHTAGPTYPPGQPPARSAGRKRGKAQKADDYYTMSLCLKDHGNLHALRGFFSGFTGTELRAWQDARVAELHERFDAEQAELAALGAGLATADPLPITPVPSALDGFEPVSAAAEFASAYELPPQVEHDLARLLRRAVRAGQEGRV